MGCGSDVDTGVHRPRQLFLFSSSRCARELRLGLRAAFTFIASQEKTAPKSKCWLKKAGYHRGAEHATGTVSGVVRRE